MSSPSLGAPCPSPTPGSSLSEAVCWCSALSPDVLTELLCRPSTAKAFPQLQPASCSLIAHSAHTGRAPTVPQARGGRGREEDLGLCLCPLHYIVWQQLSSGQREAWKYYYWAAFATVVKPFAVTDPFPPARDCSVVRALLPDVSHE